MSALRSALSAISNAEAVDPGPGRPAGTGGAHFAGTVAGLGAGEAERPGIPALYEYIFAAAVLVIAGLQARGGQVVR